MNSLDTVSDEQRPTPANNPLRFELPLLSRDRALSLVRCATPAEACAVLFNVPATAVAGITCCNVAVVWDMESCYAEPESPFSAYAYKLCGQEPWLPFEHLDMATLPVELEALLERAASAEAEECESLTFLLSLVGSEKLGDGASIDNPDNSACAVDRKAEALETKPTGELGEEADAVDHVGPELEAEPTVVDETGFAEDTEAIAANAVVEEVTPEGLDCHKVADVAAAPRSKLAASESSESVLTGNPLEGGSNAGGTSPELPDDPGRDRVMKPGSSSPAQAPRGLFGDQGGRQDQPGQEVRKGVASTPKKAEPKRRGAVATIAAKAAEFATAGKPAATPTRAGAQRGDRDADINEAVENAKRSAEIAASGHVRQVEHGAISR